MTRNLAFLVFFGLLVLFVMSFAGASHPAGDSLAVFRPGLALGLLLTGLCLKLRTVGAVACLCAALGLVPFALDRLRAGGLDGLDGSGGLDGPALVLYQKNLSYRLGDFAPLQADITASGADMASFQEVTRSNLAKLSGLAEQFPVLHYCPFASVGGTAVASKWPMVAGSAVCAESVGFAAMQVETPLGKLWLVSIHLHWPYPFGQAEQVRKLLPLLEALKGPVVLGGDFNMVARSHTLRTVRAATRTRRPGPLQTSFQVRSLFPLAIDHVLIPQTFEGRVSRRPKLGSDHFGLRLEVGASE